MLSRIYSQSSRSVYEPGQTLASVDRSASMRVRPQQVVRRTQLWLAFAVMLLATWATYGASAWLLERWTFQ
jgi:hypothetical protein